MRAATITSLILASLLFATSTVFGQSELGKGAINGTVKDSHGAVAEGATVTVINTETGC